MPDQPEITVEAPVVVENKPPVTQWPDMKIKSIKEQKENIEIAFVPDKTFLVLLAIHNQFERNIIAKISCSKAVAIGGYVYDSISDSYHIPCVEFTNIGYVPFSMMMRMKGVPNWEIRMPLTESVIKRFLTGEQKKDIKMFKSLYKPEDHVYHFVQMIDHV